MKRKVAVLIFLIIVRNLAIWRETCVTPELKLKTDLHQNGIGTCKTKQQKAAFITMRCSLCSALVTDKISKRTQNKKQQIGKEIFTECSFTRDQTSKAQGG